MNEFSLKLQEYIKKIENETSRKVVVKVSEMGLSGMKAAFFPHPEYIDIEVSKELKGENLENSVAHEITHGYLDYAKGYHQIFPKTTISIFQNHSISLINTMIDDIVVNKMIFDNGFLPFSPLYINVVKEEISSANKNLDYYKEFTDIEFKSHFKVHRYVLAWGITKYNNLKMEESRVLQRFLKAFRYSYPKDYLQAEFITKTIVDNDIFNPSGHLTVIKKVLELWKLLELVDIR